MVSMPAGEQPQLVAWLVGTNLLRFSTLEFSPPEFLNQEPILYYFYFSPQFLEWIRVL